MLRFQKSKTNYWLKAIPTCYLAQNNLVILEYLRVLGFQMPDRKDGLTYDQTIAVLKELAGFHAISLSYKVVFVF